MPSHLVAPACPAGQYLETHARPVEAVIDPGGQGILPAGSAGLARPERGRDARAPRARNLARTWPI